MARLNEDSYTRLSERTLAGSGIGTSPELIAGYLDIQRAVLDDQPQDTAEVQAAADEAQATGEAAQATGEAAQASADSAGNRADAAQDRADDAYALAGGKVTQVTITAPPTYTGTASAAYVQAEMQALMDQVGKMTSAVRSIVAALKV